MKSCYVSYKEIEGELIRRVVVLKRRGIIKGTQWVKLRDLSRRK